MKPCRHLDYDEKSYPQCRLIVLDDFDIPVKYWDRLEGGTISREELREFPNTAIKVQFCKLRGRIKGVFQCYNPSETSCHEVEEEKT